MLNRLSTGLSGSLDLNPILELTLAEMLLARMGIPEERVREASEAIARLVRS